MAHYWILKSEPAVYPYAQLVKERRTVWSGVRNPQALANIRAMRPGDRALIYHSNEGKALVGLARIVSAPYADPDAGDPKLVVVDVEADRPLTKPVTLAAIKADGSFADLGLVRQSRLSVIPVPAEHWKRLLKMAGETRQA